VKKQDSAFLVAAAIAIVVARAIAVGEPIR
jgi:hypothetical protein